jgi:hypothetical protein
MTGFARTTSDRFIKAYFTAVPYEDGQSVERQLAKLNSIDRDTILPNRQAYPWVAAAALDDQRDHAMKRSFQLPKRVFRCITIGSFA